MKQPTRRRRVKASEIWMKAFVWALLVCFLMGSLGVVLLIAH
jgi:hypothetical protein